MRGALDEGCTTVPANEFEQLTSAGVLAFIEVADTFNLQTSLAHAALVVLEVALRLPHGPLARDPQRVAARRDQVLVVAHDENAAVVVHQRLK